MIVSKNKIVTTVEESAPTPPDVGITTEIEAYNTNAIVEVYKAVRAILSNLKVDPNDNDSPPLFKSIKVNTGQVSRLKNNTWNKEGAIGLPAVFMHFINLKYLVGQSNIAEGKATLRVYYVLNRLNNGDDNYETEGWEMFGRINAIIQENKSKFPALVSRFQLAYFEQPETFDDGVQPYWIDYDVWFNDFSAYRYKRYVDTYVVIPPFTNHSDQAPGVNVNEHPDHKVPTIEEVANFETELDLEEIYGIVDGEMWVSNLEDESEIEFEIDDDGDLLIHQKVDSQKVFAISETGYLWKTS